MSCIGWTVVELGFIGRFEGDRFALCIWSPLFIAQSKPHGTSLCVGMLLGLSFLTRFENLLLIATAALILLWVFQTATAQLIDVLYRMATVYRWMELGPIRRNRKTDLVSSLLGTINFTPSQRDATPMGTRTIWNGHLEPSFATTGIELRVANRKAKLAHVFFLGRMDSLAGYEHPQSV